MDTSNKLDILLKIINSCAKTSQLETTRDYVRRTSFFSSDPKLLNTCVKMIESADTEEYMDCRTENYGETYDCEKYITEIQKKRGVVSNTSFS